jgi:dipeptidyl aminopeptidase/acylaminoacyl peptidase
MTTNTRLAAAILLALASSAVLAKPEPKTIAEPKTPAELFAKHPDYAGATLSPSGEFVAVTTPFEDRRALSIIRLSGKYDTSVIKFGTHELVSDATWVDDQRFVVQKAYDVGYLEQPMTKGEWFAADADAGNQIQLWGYIEDDGVRRGKLKDEGYASLVGGTDAGKGEALFYFQPWMRSASSAITRLFRVDTRTGKRQEIESISDQVGIYADRAGNARFVHGVDLDGRQFLRYRKSAADTGWAEAPATLAGSEMQMFYFEPDNDHFYANISDKGEPATFYRAQISTGTRERLAGHPDLEVSSSYSIGHGAAPYAVAFHGGRPKIDFIDPKSEWSQLHAGLLKSFPGQLVAFEGISKDNNKVLFYVYSDRHPGAYYLYDRTTKAPALLFETMPWIDPAKMAPTAPIEFKNRSGEKIYAFYTAPAGKTGPLPLIVMPHGGPFYVSDSWGFDADAQFLASQGYAVLQVNFRGSANRGQNFESAAHRGWGTTIQDDIADAVNAVVAQNLADKNKVCIYGGSFGAYSAMMNPIRNPGMYKCAIGYAGVYDLDLLSGEEDASKQSRSWFKRMVGDSPEVFNAQSPARHADQLNLPILLIHGKADRIASFNQYQRMADALKKAGKPFDTLVKADEGHGFYSEVNQAEAYEKIAEFLKKNNPAN